MGRYAEAESLLKRSLEIDAKLLGSNDEEFAITLINLGYLYDSQGRYDEAEPLYKRVLEIFEKALGLDHPDVATALNNLAGLYFNQGRYAEVEPLYKRSLEIREKALGHDHPVVATGLNNLALLYSDQGRYAEAEPLLKRSLEIREKAFGPGRPKVATGLNNLAGLYFDQGRYAEAEPLYKRSLEIREKALGHDHPDVALGLNNLALLYYGQSRYAEAELLYKRSLAINEKALGHDHPNVASGLGNLAFLYRDQGRLPEALDHIRRATAVHRARAKAGAGKSSSGALSEQKKERPTFAFHVDVTYQMASKDSSQAGLLHGEAFEVSQLARATAAASAVAQLGARFATGEDRLAQLVREHQDTLGLWQDLDAALIEEIGKPPDERNAEVEKSLRAELAAADKRLTELGRVLADEFPQYAELANPQPAALSEVQQLLGPAEALLAYLVGYEASYLWVVRSDAAEMHKIKISSGELANKVTELRRALDPTNVRDPSDIRNFDVPLAHELYTLIFSPAEPLLAEIPRMTTTSDHQRSHSGFR